MQGKGFFFTLDAFDPQFNTEEVAQQEVLQCQVFGLRSK